MFLQFAVSQKSVGRIIKRNIQADLVQQFYT